jgi:hypothetical protein
MREHLREIMALVEIAGLPRTTSAVTAADAVQQFMNDDDEKVREAAAKVAVALRGQRLGPFQEIITALIRSPVFTPASPQLFITLEQAPDRVDSLILQAAQRLIEVNRTDIGNIATRAAADAREIGELVIRAYAQANDAATRATALDMIDGLLLTERLVSMNSCRRRNVRHCRSAE